MTVTDASQELSQNLDVLHMAERWLKEGRKIALATVVDTWGSAPRPVGSHLLIDETGEFEGSVSGGCVEGAVVSDALDVLETNAPKLLEFGVADETAWQVGLSCGGKINVYVQPFHDAQHHSLLNSLNGAREKREAIGLLTQMRDGHNTCLLSSEDLQDANLKDAFERALRTGKSGRLQDAAGVEYFLSMQVPPAKIVVIGAVHITQALVPMAQAAGFDVTVIDPRTAFASEERFPGVALLAEWPEDVLADLRFDAYTAVAAVTHDPKIDDFPIIEALKANCFYVGALGSRKTHAKRCERLLTAGLSETLISRIKAPIGLDLGAASPAEIAVAVLAEIVLALRGSKASQKKEA